MISETKYSSVFNRLCHLAALSKEGKTRAAIDNILMTVLAINRTDPVSTSAHLAEQIEGYFGLTFNVNTLQASIDRNLSNGSLVRDRETKTLALNPHLKADIEERIHAAEELERSVRAEWFSSIDHRVAGITQLSKEQLLKDSAVANMQQAIDQRAVAVRLLLALVCAVAGFSIVFILPMIRPWHWLNEHPKKSGLYLSGCLIVLGLSWMIADPKRRMVASLPLVLGAILALTQII